jgi:hypothetical protein
MGYSKQDLKVNLRLFIIDFIVKHLNLLHNF